MTRGLRLICALALASVASRPAVIQAHPNEDEVVSITLGEAQTTPWSGWWWPAWAGLGPTLYSPSGPLAKYDQYVALTSGGNPETQEWERQRFALAGNRWAGHCNGYAAAALLEPEPTQPVNVLGIAFSVGDLKGLLVDYHFADTAAWSYGETGELNPADFHRALVTWLGNKGTGFVVTFEYPGGESWSYPVYRFESRWSADSDDADLVHVKTTVWMVDSEVPPDFVGTRMYPGAAGQTFEYTLRGDPDDPQDGAWTGASLRTHPSRIWYPDAAHRNLYRELTSPQLDYETITNIIAASDGTNVTAQARLEHEAD